MIPPVQTVAAVPAEMRLIKAVELKIALAADDKALGKVLGVYLCPLILKLDSPNADSRRKVGDILGMIDTRMTGNQDVDLPFNALLSQYKDSTISTSTKERTLNYLSQAFGEVHFTAQTVSSLLHGYASAPESQQVIIFRLICRILSTFEIPISTAQELEDETAYHMPDVEVRSALARRLSDMMLLDPSQLSHHSRGLSLDRGGITRPLSEADAAFLLPQELPTISTLTLNKIKLGILRFSSINSLSIAERYIIALIASLDLNNEIQLQASSILRRCDISQDEELYVRLLCNLLLERPNIDNRLQTRIYDLLSRSTSSVKDIIRAQHCVTFGLESKFPKVRSAAIRFLGWIARFPYDGVEPLQTRNLLSQLTQFLSSTDSSDEAKSSAYIAIGLLCKGDIPFVHENVEIVRTLFSALSNENAILRPAIEEALSELVHIFVDASEESRTELRNILYQIISEAPVRTHYTALKFVLANFDFSDIAARWLCILALGVSSTAESQREARRGLNIYLFQLSGLKRRQNQLFPAFEDLVTWGNHTIPAVSALSTGSSMDTSSTIVYFNFATTCLYANVLADQRGLDLQQEDIEVRLLDTIHHDASARSLLQSYASEDRGSFQEAFQIFQHQVFDSYMKYTSTSIGDILLDLFTLKGDGMAIQFSSRFDELDIVRKTLNETEREVHFRLMSVVLNASNHDSRRILDYCETLVVTTTVPIDNVDNFLLLAQILLRSHLTDRRLDFNTTSLELLLVVYLDTRDLRLLRASLKVISILSLTSHLKRRSNCVSTLLKIVRKSSIEDALREQIAVALGYLATGLDSSSPELVEILEYLLVDEIQQTKVELILAKAEALASSVGCWNSKILQNSLDVSGTVHQLAYRPIMTKFIIDKLLQTATSSRPQERKGACLRLISLVQALDLPEMRAKLPHIHKVFLTLLSDNDDFVVESANKGIQVVYGRCDQRTKDDLLAQLFATMTSDATAKGNLAARSEESELFQPGTVKIGSGSKESSLNTYKDICNLAVDAGNSSLIYSFLNLASSSAMWSSRRGVALGLSSLLTEESAQNNLSNSPELLARLLPKLYRYKHDPSSKVAKAMQSIFIQLYSDPVASLDSNFRAVCQELMHCLSDQAWRVRESAARALTNLIVGRSLVKLADYLEEIWSLALRVLDDVKESVRSAGVDLCQSLSNLVLRAIGNGQSNASTTRILDFVVPLFVKNLKSLSKDVSAFSLKTLLRLTKESGPSIKPYLPLLIEEFLQLTSSMEPEMLNYLSFHAAKYNITQEDLDDHRLASMRASPLVDALEQCIDQLDAESAREAIPLVCQIVRQTNGLPTKAATARFLISLTVRNPSLLVPHADAVVQALSASLYDRSQSVVGTYASCIGYVARVASAEKLVKLFNFVSVRYFKAEDQNHALGLVLKAVSQNANDKFNSMASVFYPLSFLGMHDPDEAAAAIFKQVWQDNTGSSQVMKLYLGEILPMLEGYLSSPFWRIKQMSASTIGDIAQKIDLGAQTERVLQILVTALKGKSWNGKEAVLEALVALTSRSSTKLEASQAAEVRTIVYREARRTNLGYKRHALKHLATFLDTDKNISSITTSFTDTLETVEDTIDGSAMEEDTSDEPVSQPLKLVLIQNALTCLVKSFRPEGGSSEDYQTLLRYCGQQASEQPWNIKSQICLDLRDLFGRMLATPPFWHDADVVTTWTLLHTLATDRGYQSLREEAARTITVFAKACVAQHVSSERKASIGRDLGSLVEHEQSTIVQAMLRAVDLS